LNGLIIIDEIQLRPNLFPILRVLIDKNSEQQKYIILGSASRDLIQQSSESLAGRIAYIEITPLNSIETDDLEKLWLVGGYPKSYLMPNMPESAEWRKNYIRTFLERDIPSLGIKIEPNALRRFWMMLAHYHGNICNVSELARSLNVTSPTIKRYIDILVGTFMLRELKPWHENISKRQVKQSKVYFRDSGLLHSMLGILSVAELQTNPKLGGSWEGYALEEVIRRLDLDTEDCYFWATHQGGELDLLVYKNDKKYGFEFKYSDAPTMTKSLYSALDSLELESVTIVYPGATSYQLSEQVSVKNLRHVTIV
jgi:predicted AAA+ superfamily ATPase